MTRAVFAITAFAVLCPATAWAHDTYLMPAAFALSQDEAQLGLTSAEKFPKLEYGPKRARVQKMEVRGETATAKLEIASESKTALQFTLSNGRGFQVAGVALAPHDIRLAPDKVAEYFEEVGANAEVRRAYEALEQPRQWNERYTKYAKTIVCVAPCRDDDAASRPLGFALEFVAQQRTGTSRSFQLLRHGKPAARQPVTISDARGVREHKTTDADGMVQVTEAGTYLLSVVTIEPPEGPGGKFTSDFATLTFAVGKDGRFAGTE